MSDKHYTTTPLKLLDSAIRWLVGATPGIIRSLSPPDWQVTRELKSLETAYVSRRVSWTSDGKLMSLDLHPGHMQRRPVCDGE